MKTKSILLEYSGVPLDDLPDKIRQQVEQSPDLKREFQAQAEVAGWLRLKSYEQPDPALYGRVRHRVNIRLKNAPAGSVSESWPQGVPGWGRILAVIMVLLGLSVLTHREMLSNLPEEEISVANVPSGPVLQEEAPELFQPDPFTTYVLRPEEFGFELEEPLGLTRQLEADFEALGLSTTNTVFESNFTPVSLPLRP